MNIVLDDRFIRPRYNGHCFADLPATIKWILTGQGAPSLAPVLLTALVVLPFAGESVWWYEKDKFEMTKHGAHGGLTPDEKVRVGQ